MRAITVAKRVTKQVYNDKRSLALLFVAPILVMFILYTVIMSGTSTPIIELVDAPDKFVEALKKRPVIIRKVTEKEALTNIRQGRSNAALVFQRTLPTIYVEGSDPGVTKLVLYNVQQAALSHLPFPIPKPDILFIYGSKEFTLFDSFAPVLMGFFIFFFVFIISGISFVRERLSGTLDRLLATPLRRGEIVAGYFLSFGFFVSIQTVLLQLFVIFCLEVPLKGNFFLLLLLNILLASVSLSLGLFLSAFARNEFQLFQFIPIVIIPQILFSGLFDISEAPLWVNILSSIFPLTYAAEALRDIMIRGYGLGEIYKEIFILCGYGLFFLFLNSMALKRYRKI